MKRKPSSLTPLMRNAAILYKYSFGLIPAVIGDLELCGSNVQIRLKKLRLVPMCHSMVVLGSYCVVLGFMLAILIKAFYSSLRIPINILQISFLILLIIGIYLIFATARTFLTNQQAFQHCNKLLANEMSVCKLTILKNT